MKKKLLLMAACLGAMFAFTACGSKDDGNTLTVLNYGKYIESSVLDAFEEETGIHVNYEEYVNPEEMYTKYKSGAIDYDVICTSDYMVERLINEGEAKEINFDKIPLSKNLDDSYFEFSKAFDPENKYSMPYFFGTVGILYNKNKVDANDVKSWDILWNKKYKDQIIMEDSVDESADEVVAGNASMALVYSGEAAYAESLSKDLDYSVPEEGSNMWIDSWLIAKTCKHQENAEKFLDFLCREDIAMKNTK